MTVVILLLECFSETPTDVPISLHMFYYSILTCTQCTVRYIILICISMRCVIDSINYYLICAYTTLAYSVQTDKNLLNFKAAAVFTFE